MLGMVSCLHFSTPPHPFITKSYNCLSLLNLSLCFPEAAKAPSLPASPIPSPFPFLSPTSPTLRSAKKQVLPSMEGKPISDQITLLVLTFEETRMFSMNDCKRLIFFLKLDKSLPVYCLQNHSSITKWLQTHFAANSLHFWWYRQLSLCVFLTFNFFALHIEGSRPEWYISSMIYSRDTPFWSETLTISDYTFSWSLSSPTVTKTPAASLSGVWELTWFQVVQTASPFAVVWCPVLPSDRWWRCQARPAVCTSALRSSPSMSLSRLSHAATAQRICVLVKMHIQTDTHTHVHDICWTQK